MNTGVETPIQVCYTQARSLQAYANMPKGYKNITYPHAYMLAMQLQGLEVITIGEVTQSHIDYLIGHLLAFTKYCLHVYGEVAVIKIKKENQAKSEEYRVTVLFTCYNANCPMIAILSLIQRL